VYFVALDSVPSGVGIHEVEELGFTVFPNPATDVLRFRFTDSSTRSSVGMTVRLLDMRGSEVLVQRVTGQNATLSLQNIPSGLYFLEATNAEGRKRIRKVLKE